MKISIIIPVLNESENCQTLIRVLTPFAGQAGVIFVDGGSADDTVSQLSNAGFEVILAKAGRALQMNQGYQHATADVYWFLHADCVPPRDSLQLIETTVKNGFSWGRFDVRLSGKKWIFRIIEYLMNRRSCLTGIATGDQGIFITHDFLNTVGGFPDIPLMEDIEISRRLKKTASPACIDTPMMVSSRRWEKYGIAKTILLMWWLRLLYFFGVNPVRLKRIYYRA